MLRCRWSINLQFLAICLWSLHAASEPVPLEPGAWREIKFADVKPTTYQFIGGEWVATVEASASAMILPLRSVTTIRGFELLWQSEGDFRVKDSTEEAEKDGDDAQIRLGLVIHGSKPTIPFFAPAWIKLLADTVHYPADRLVYYVMGAKHPPGSTWPSPYHDDIIMVSAPAGKTQGSWQSTRVELEQPLRIVALWIMADGDNTGSKFISKVRDLKLLL